MHRGCTCGGSAPAQRRGGAAPKETQHELKSQTTTSECAAETDVCTTGEVRAAVAEFAGKRAPPAGGEAKILEDPEFHAFATRRGIPRSRIEQELAFQFKPAGPRDSLQLLSNFDIDAVLGRWAAAHPEFFNHGFNMIDFEATGGSLARVRVHDILEGRAAQKLGPRGVARRPCTHFACVLNTDVSTGRGKHWVAVFGDCRPAPPEPWTVEYFNSAGNPPPSPVTRWMETTALDLESARPGVRVETHAVTDVRHQSSQTECGLYALYYIRCRLVGVPHHEFRGRRIPDEKMTEFRRHVFRPAGGPR